MAGSDRVKIVGDHPHRGETGTLTGKAFCFKHEAPDAPLMREVRLDPGPGIGGQESCMAEDRCLRSLPPSEDPYA